MTHDRIVTRSRPRTRALIAVPPPMATDRWRAKRENALDELHSRMSVCRKCVVAGFLGEANGVAGYRGRIGDRVMVIGQAPGRLSVEKRIPFSGPSGRVLDRWLQIAGFAPGALYREVYLSALTKCDPGKSPIGKGDRKPTPDELSLCRPYLLRELELVRPEVILLVGSMAIEAFLGPMKLNDVVGRAFERNGVRLLPLPHPSGVSRWLNDPEHQRQVEEAMALLAASKRQWEAQS